MVSKRTAASRIVAPLSAPSSKGLRAGANQAEVPSLRGPDRLLVGGDVTGHHQISLKRSSILGAVATRPSSLMRSRYR